VGIALTAGMKRPAGSSASLSRGSCLSEFCVSEDHAADALGKQISDRLTIVWTLQMVRSDLLYYPVDATAICDNKTVCPFLSDFGIAWHVTGSGGFEWMSQQSLFF
jgi:hypothetical protein